MPRPSQQGRIDTVDTLARVLVEPHYAKAADAYGLMDLTPQAFGVQPDPIRVMARAMTSHITKETPHRAVTEMVGSYLSRKRGASEDLENSPDSDEPIGPRIEERKPGTTEKKVTISFAGRPYNVPISKGVDLTARVLISIIAGVFLLAPMFALSYIEERRYRLMTTSLFTFVFAIALSVLSEAKNQELVTATAAYAAVLVVFIGTSTP